MQKIIRVHLRTVPAGESHDIQPCDWLFIFRNIKRWKSRKCFKRCPRISL